MNVPSGSPPLSKLAQAMLAALQAAPARSLAPADLARMLAAGAPQGPSTQPAQGEPADWRALLAPVRQTGLALARAGHVVVVRKGRPVPAGEARGVIRLALPERCAEPLAPDAAAPPASTPSSL